MKSDSPTLSQPEPAISVPILRVPFDAEDRDFIAKGLKEILDTGGLTMGKYTAAFEEEFAKLSGTAHAVATSNCTTALEIIFRAIGVEGKSVIVPTNTFIATAFAAVHAGAKVVFADSDPKTLCLDPKDVARRIRPDTKAVVLVHIGGIISPAVEELKKLCDSKGIALVEDCAHAHGSTYKGIAAGAWGLAGAFSFFPTKPLVSGEGGMITTKDAALADKARMLRNHGKNPALKNRISELGHNWRLSEVTALIGLAQTRKAGELFRQRKESARYYDEHLKDLKGAKILKMPEGLDSTFYKYVLFLDPGVSRDALKKLMKEEFKVSLTGEVYDAPCHKEPVWEKHLGIALNVSDRFPGAEEIAARHICLPLYPGLTEAELAHTVESLKEALGEAREGMNVLAVVAHPDDELLGPGATLARHVRQGANVHVAICVGKPNLAMYSEERYGGSVLDGLHEKAQKAGKLLGFKSVRNLGLLDEMLEQDLNSTVTAVEEVVAEVKPELVYLHHGGDTNQDHRGAFKAALVAVRGYLRPQARRVLCFETPSSTEQSPARPEWQFQPNWFVDVSKTLEAKLKALKIYKDEMRPFPHPRSYEALRALAAWRGSAAGFKAAEAFELVRGCEGVS